jgi:starch synthase (maltosyl-transferring)
LDPHAVRETTVHLDMPELHLPDHFPVRDLITGAEWQWGAHNFVHLDPFQEPVHVLEVLR